MITVFFKSPEAPKLLERKRFSADSWVRAINPDETELQSLAHRLKLKAGHLLDALDPLEVPRLEREGGQLYLYTRVPFEEGAVMSTVPLLVILVKDMIITISDKRLPSVEALIRKSHLESTKSLDVFVALFNHITGSYQVALNLLNRRVNNIRGKYDRIGNRDILELVTIEDTMNNYLSSLALSRTVFKDILAGKNLKLPDPYFEKVEDVYHAMGQMIEVCQTNITSLTNLREAYSTILTNNLNRVIKLFTSLTIILTIPTIISSFFGMNVALPLEHPWAFFYILIGTIAVSGIILTIFIKNDWL
jgi:magnesium transporter